jgi:PAS domain S-box-containing protein
VQQNVSARRAPPPLQAQIEGERKMRILLIEDNQADARLIQELLKELSRPEQRVAPPEVVWAVCLAQGLEALAEQKVDVVLLDLSLPDSHGLETLYRTQDRAGAVPIVVLTGNNEEMLAIKAVRQGAQDYLIKSEVTGPALWRATCYAVERARTLARWEESYRILQYLPISLYVYNPRDWKIVYCNRRFASVIGVDENLVFRSGISLKDLVHAEDLPRFHQERQPALAANSTEIVQSRYRIKTAPQAWQWVQAFETVYVRTNAGLPELVLGNAYAVADAFLTDESASNELDLLRTIADSLTDAVFAKDPAGRYVYANAAHRRSLGIKARTEVVGKTDFDFVPEHLARALHQKEEQILRGARMAPDEEEPWISPDGQRRAIRLISRAPLRDKQGRVNGLLAMSRDITAERRTAQAAAPQPVGARPADPRAQQRVPPQVAGKTKPGPVPAGPLVS